MKRTVLYWRSEKNHLTMQISREEMRQPMSEIRDRLNANKGLKIIQKVKEW